MLPQKDLNPLWCSGEQLGWRTGGSAQGWWYSKRPLFLVGDSWIKERSSWQWTQQEDPRNLLTAEFSVQNKKLNFQPRTKIWLGRTISKPVTTFKDQTGKTSFYYYLIFWWFLSFFVRLFNGNMKHLRNVASSIYIFCGGMRKILLALSFKHTISQREKMSCSPHVFTKS